MAGLNSRVNWIEKSLSTTSKEFQANPVLHYTPIVAISNLATELCLKFRVPGISRETASASASAGAGRVDPFTRSLHNYYNININIGIINIS